MEYNTSRAQLLLPEYGRSVHQMVQHLLTIEDPTKRLEQANVVIEIMSILNPQLRSTEDYRHKLWDHIYQISDFQLDVAGPYPPPDKELLMARPDPLPYPHESKSKVRHFGKNLEAVINKALAETDDQKRQGFTQIIGYYMKLAYTNWHKEPVHDDMIRNELAQLSNGVLNYEPGGYKVYFDTRQAGGGNQNKRNRNFKGNNNRNFKGNSNYNKNRKYKNK